MKLLSSIKRKQACKVLITSCRELSIDGFIRCLYRDDYSALVIGGNPKPEDIQDAWGGIFEEYSILTDNKDYMHLLRMMSEMVRVTKKYLIVKAALIGLTAVFSVELADGVRKAGFNLKLDPSLGLDEYHKDLERLVSIAKNMKVQMEMKGNEIKEHNERLNKEEKGSEEDFLDGVMIIGRHQQYHIDMKNTSIAEYAVMLKQYNRWSDRQKALDEKHK